MHVTAWDIAEIEAVARATKAAGELPPALLAKWPVIERGKRRGGAVIAPDCEWIVPLEPEAPAYA